MPKGTTSLRRVTVGAPEHAEKQPQRKQQEPLRGNQMKRIAIMLGITAVLMAGNTTPASAAATWDCPQGHVCFWTGPDGTGSRCIWNNDDNDWSSAPIVCSWAGSQNVKSVWNNSGRGAGVIYYSRPNTDDDKYRIGCTRKGQSGNLTGTYKIKSHRWTTGRCG